MKGENIVKMKFNFKDIHHCEAVVMARVKVAKKHHSRHGMKIN